MTFNDDRRSEAPATPHEFPQAWWTVLHAMHGAPTDFQASRPASVNTHRKEHGRE